jgi:hypothetical protein
MYLILKAKVLEEFINNNNKGIEYYPSRLFKLQYSHFYNINKLYQTYTPSLKNNLKIKMQKQKSKPVK